MAAMTEKRTPDTTQAFAAMGESCLCLESVARLVIRTKSVVIMFWLLVTICLIPFATRFTEVLKISLDAPPGSGSEAALRVFQEHFPSNAYTARYVGYIEVAKGSVLDIPHIDEFSAELQSSLAAQRPLTQYMSVPAYKKLTSPLADAAPPMPVPFSSKDETAMLFAWATADDPASPAAMAYSHESSHIFINLVEKMLGDAVIFSGTDSYSQVAGQSVAVARADLERTDLLCMPITAIVLLLVVESWRLLLIPLMACAVAAVVSFAATYVLGTFWLPVQAITPSLMMCLIISLSIDYSIFLLTRFREELIAGKTESGQRDVSTELVEAAICTTLATSGATILLSGCCLLFAFVFLAFFPVDIVASMGIGACITMVFLVVVNLTLVPALLLSFPGFFTTGLTDPPSMASERFHNLPRKGWRWLSLATTRFPQNLGLLGIVVGLSLCVSLPILHMKESIDMRQCIASGSHMQQTAERIHNKFGGGLAYPFEALILPVDKTMPILSKRFFDASADFVESIMQEVELRMPEAKGTGYDFISYQTGQGRVPWEDMSLLCSIEKTAAPFNAESRMLKEKEQEEQEEYEKEADEMDATEYGVPGLKELCMYYLDQTTNSLDYRKIAPTAAYGVIVATIEPMSHHGSKLLSELRRAADRLGPKYGMTIAIGGTPAKALDMVDLLYSTLPIAAVATLSTAMIFLALAFRSLVIPLRSIVSNLLTLGVTYGITILVYQDGVFDFLGFESINGKYNALPWFSPVVAFFIITGIGLDYDIFLLVRVTELRGKGLDPQTAIQEGLCSTGGIITAAGMVMVFAFSGMLFSQLVQATMFGFMMVLAVIYDTFIARSIVNPAGMSLLGYWNWYPSALCKPGQLTTVTPSSTSKKEEYERLDTTSHGSESGFNP